MPFHPLAPGQDVFAIAYAPTAAVAKGEPPVELGLLVFWGDGREPTRAAWVWRQRLAGWAVVGEA